MALQADILIAESNHTVSNCYYRITRVDFTKERALIQGELWADEATANPDPDPLTGMAPKTAPIHLESRYLAVPEDLVMPGDNILVWAYNELKALPEFAGALDV